MLTGIMVIQIMATIKCLDEGIDFLHIDPYYDNPNFPHTIVKELTHLKTEIL